MIEALGDLCVSGLGAEVLASKSGFRLRIFASANQNVKNGWAVWGSFAGFLTQVGATYFPNVAVAMHSLPLAPPCTHASDG